MSKPSKHWVFERIFGGLFYALGLWFVCAVTQLVGTTQLEAKAWLAEPTNTALMILFVISGVLHHRFHLQEVFTDYIHNAGVYKAASCLLKLVSVVLIAAGIFAIYTVTITG